MARAIDEKIVKMKMDSTDFQSKVEKVLGIFGKLNKSFESVKAVDTSKSVRAISNVGDAASRVDMNKLIASVDAVGGKFSAMSIIAITALQNITNRAIDAGVNIAKALTITPILSGFQEYETKMTAIQTMLSNTGGKSSLEDVTRTLDDLNSYADKTIYSFGEMTKNVGTFTAAGVGLEDSAMAIKGISNLAAASGSNSQQASTAMYQLSQAISNGKVNLQDWNSVVNAGMGGALFQNALRDTAEGMGVAIDRTQSFRESLESGWLSSEILLNTLNQFSTNESMLEAATKVRTFTALVDTAKEALGSGWAKTWELMFGDFNEAGDMWTKANDVISGMINNSSDARNVLAQSFIDMGGRAEVINSIVQAFGAMSKVFTSGKGAWEQVFPPVTAETLMNIVWGLEKFAYGLWLSDEAAGNVQMIFQSMFTIIKNALTGISQVFGIITDVLKEAFPDNALSNINNFIESIETLSNKLVMNQETMDKVKRVFEGVVAVFSIIIQVAVRVKDAIVGMLPEEGFGSGLLDFFVSVADMIVSFDEGMKAGNGFSDFLDGLVDVVGNVAKYIWEFASATTDFLIGLTKGFDTVRENAGPILDKIIEWVKNLVEAFDMKDILTVGFIGTMVAGFKKFQKLQDSVTGMADSVSGVFGSVNDAISNLGGITDALSTLTSSVKVASLMGIAIAVGVLALSIKLLSTIDGQDIAKSLEVLGFSLLGMTQVLNIIGRMDFTGGSAVKAAVLLMAVAGSVLLLAGALKVISTIDEADMLNSLSVLVAVIMAVVVAIKSLATVNGKMMAGAGAMIALSISVVILAGALKILATMDGDELFRSVATLGAIFLELALFMKIVDGAKFKPSSAIGLVIVTGAIVVLVGAIKEIGALPVEDLKKGLTVVSLVLLELALFVKMTSGAKVMSAAVGVLAVAGALKMLVGPLKTLGEMDQGKLTQGLIALGVALLGIVVAMKLARGSGSGAASILLMAVAIKILVPPLETLSKLSLKQVATGLGALAGAFIIIGVAGMLLGPAAPGLIAFAIAITAIGLAMAAVGIGLLGAAAALTALAAMTATTIAAVIGSLGLLIVGFTSLIPAVIDFAVTLVVELAKGIAKTAPTLVDKGLELILKFLEALNEHVPKIIDVGTDLIINLATSLSENLPKLLETGATVIIDLVNGMAETLRENDEELANAMKNIIEAMLEALITGLIAILDVLLGWIPGFSEMTSGLGGAAKDALRLAFDIGPVGDERSLEFIAGVNGATGGARVAGTGLGQATKDGVASIETGSDGTNLGSDFIVGVDGKQPEANSAGVNLANQTKTGAGAPDATPEGTGLGADFLVGVDGKQSAANTTGRNLANKSKAGLETVSANSSGRNFAEGFAGGIDEKQSRVSSAGSTLGSLAKSALNFALGIFSPSREMIKSGGFFGDGFAMGIADRGKMVTDRASRMAQGAVDAVKSYAAQFSDAMLDNMDLNPKITPVLDLGNVSGINLDSRVNVRGLDGLKNSVDTRGLNGISNSQSTQTNEYNINITANGDLPQPTIKKMAKAIQTEIKNQNDRARFSRGEAVVF